MIQKKKLVQLCDCAKLTTNGIDPTQFRDQYYVLAMVS